MITIEIKSSILDMSILTIALYGETPWPLVVEPVMAAVAILKSADYAAQKEPEKRCQVCLKLGDIVEKRVEKD